MTTKQLEQEALRKSPQERERLAYRLFHSVEPGDDAVLTPEFIAMLERASKEAEEHPETLTTLDEVERELDEEFARKEKNRDRSVRKGALQKNLPRLRDKRASAEK